LCTHILGSTNTSCNESMSMPAAAETYQTIPLMNLLDADEFT
jgi:hypothetical protein